MDFYIGQIFKADYPEEAAEWCNNNQAVMTQIQPISDETGNIRRFQIQTIQPPQVTHTDLSEFLYQQKCKVAYTGVKVIKNQIEYLFETTQDSITMCNSMALAITAQPNDFIINWKVWKNDTPTMLSITKEQFNSIFSFGMLMINTAFSVQGLLNQQLQTITQQQLADTAFIEEFKTNAISEFSKINTTLTI